MTEQERLQHIKEELEAILKELKPRLNELFYIEKCLKDLHRVSNGKNPKMA